jgi:hypothetical protein
MTVKLVNQTLLVRGFIKRNFAYSRKNFCSILYYRGVRLTMFW